MKTSTAVAMVLATIVLSTPLAQGGLTFDPAADFSIVNGNPNGVWSYGYTEPGTLTGDLKLFKLTGSGPGQTSGSYEEWVEPMSFGAPNINHNPSSEMYDYYDVRIGPGELDLHPGPRGEFSIARFTVPVSGQYRVNGSFSGGNSHPTTTDVHILFNGVLLFNDNVNGFGGASARNFDLTLSAAIGDYIDFAVGFGSNLGFDYDSTILAATLVTPVPEPTTWIAGVLCVLPLVAGLVRRRRA